MTIREDIRSFVMSAFYAPIAIGDEASLLDAGIIDSTGLIEVIAFIEENYTVPIADSDLRPENFGSIAQISAYVERRLRDLGRSAEGPGRRPGEPSEIEASPASGTRALPSLDRDDGAASGGPLSTAG